MGKYTKIKTTPLIPIPQKTYHPKVNLAIDYIWGSYWMILDEVEASHIADLTPQHFSILFKEVTGKTFMQYCSALRINRAAWLLQNTDMEIKDISHVCGYETPSYFSHRFHQLTKQTPLQYREEVSRANHRQNQSTE